jgi:RNA polymerase sigma factor for flagellar operon FliA
MNHTENPASEAGKNQAHLQAAKQAYGTVWHLAPAEREQLLMEQLPQVRYIARRIHDRLPQHVPLEDLVHAGVLGLMEALPKFDPSKNVELRSYAKYRIQGAILDSLRELDWSPRPLRKKARQLEQAHQRLRGRLGRSATETELAVELSIKLEELRRLLIDLRGLDLGSLQAEFAEDGQEQPALSRLADEAQQDPFQLCLESEMETLVAQAVADLSPRERQVLALYYYKELTMKEVGAVLGVGEARVSQIHSASLVRLRARLRELLESRGPERLAATRTAPAQRNSAWTRF